MEKTIKGLYDQVKALGAGQAHFKAEQIFNDSDAIAVVSVYNGERPSNEILDELFEWAEENKDERLIDKIEELALLK